MQGKSTQEIQGCNRFSGQLPEERQITAASTVPAGIENALVVPSCWFWPYQERVRK